MNFERLPSGGFISENLTCAYQCWWLASSARVERCCLLPRTALTSNPLSCFGLRERTGRERTTLITRARSRTRSRTCGLDSTPAMGRVSSVIAAKSIKKANERAAYDEFLSGTVEGGLVVSGEVDLEVGVDLIGRATRALCKPALERGALDEDEDDSALHGDDGASDDDDDDDDDGGF